MRTIEDKNIPSRVGGGGGHVLIRFQNPGSINSVITICDYDEEKKEDTLPVFYRVMPSGHHA